MDFFSAVQHRRSVRRYTAQSVPENVINQAIDAALLAPNSSNMQTWGIYWVRDADKKRRLSAACLGQGAARTAPELVVFVADPARWRLTRHAIMQTLIGNPRQDLHNYYGKLVPFTYGFPILAPLKWLAFNLFGLFKPSVRGPWSSRDIEVVCIKSCALACQNFMMAIAAQNYDSCPMEGFDEVRVKRLLRLGRRTRVVMVISVGMRDPRGIWGERFRVPREHVVHTV